MAASVESSNTIFCGDCGTILHNLPSNSIDLVITSPPYFQQREYGNGDGIGNEKTIEEYINNIVSVFQQCVRITKPTGTVVFNIGDK